MIIALLMGRKESQGFPGKNTYPVCGKPLMSYPLGAALGSKHIKNVYVSTDDDTIKQYALQHSAHVIDRPKELCAPEALGEDVYVHGYHWIKEHLKKDIDILVLLMCNAPMITAELIDQGIHVLLDDESIDSAVSVSQYNMWGPVRARKINRKGFLEPMVPIDVFDNAGELSCDRDSQGDVWFADMGVSVVRSRCIENIHQGLLPQRWVGRKIYPLKQWGGFDVDYEWQIPQLEDWLRKHNLG